MSKTKTLVFSTGKVRVHSLVFKRGLVVTVEAYALIENKPTPVTITRLFTRLPSKTVREKWSARPDLLKTYRGWHAYESGRV